MATRPVRPCGKCQRSDCAQCFPRVLVSKAVGVSLAIVYTMPPATVPMSEVLATLEKRKAEPNPVEEFRAQAAALGVVLEKRGPFVVRDCTEHFPNREQPTPAAIRAALETVEPPPWTIDALDGTAPTIGAAKGEVHSVTVPTDGSLLPGWAKFGPPPEGCEWLPMGDGTVTAYPIAGCQLASAASQRRAGSHRNCGRILAAVRPGVVGGLDGGAMNGPNAFPLGLPVVANTARGPLLGVVSATVVTACPTGWVRVHSTGMTYRLLGGVHEWLVDEDRLGDLLAWATVTRGRR